MKTVLRIVEQAGGYRRNLYLRIENPPYMALVIEATPELGPCGQPALSVAHYGEQNGDLMRDPEMCFIEAKRRPLTGSSRLCQSPLPEAGALGRERMYWALSVR